MIGLEDRREHARNIEAACKAGASLNKACKVVGIAARTLQRWKAQDGLVSGDGRPQAVRPTPVHALTPEEREQIVRVANEPRFADLPPARIVPMLADEGQYIASESSFQRVLRAQGQTRHRGRARAPRQSRPPSTHVATAPRQLWSWDMSAPCRRGLQRQEKGAWQSVNRSWLIHDRQLQCCLAPVEAGRKGAAKLGRLPTAGCHAQSSLNCTGRGPHDREPGYRKVYGETTKRAMEASVLTATTCIHCGSTWCDSAGLHVPGWRMRATHPTMGSLPQPSSRAARGRARHLRT